MPVNDVNLFEFRANAQSYELVGLSSSMLAFFGFTSSRLLHRNIFMSDDHGGYRLSLTAALSHRLGSLPPLI